MRLPLVQRGHLPKALARNGARRASRPSAVPVTGLLLAVLLWAATLVLLDSAGAFADPVRGTGKAGLLAAALIALVGLLQILSPQVLRQAPRMVLLVVVALLALLPSRGILYLADPAALFPPLTAQFLLPLALAPLLASVLAGAPTAIAIGFWNSLAAALLFDGSLTVFALGLIVTIVATICTEDVRRRSQVYRAGLFAGLAAMLYAVSQGAGHLDAAALATQAAAGLASGIACAFVAAMLIPLFELLFGITTNLTLLELSDMGHPLLQRLAMEAPGTYHHSIVVANLAQAAAGRIGANALLVRACAYFHDIGKLAKPEFFNENMRFRENPHDDLAPSMSALVIMSHVKEGIGLVRRFKLPPCVVDGIRQHHGTGLVSYFFQRAKQEVENGRAAGSNTSPARSGANGHSVVEEDFRYDGPKPASREMAILMLADAVEAAARSLEKPTPGHIEGLVNDIADSRLRDGQLDECNLTLAELAAIKRSFVFTLANMLHVRIAYPSDETKSGQPSGKASATHAGDTPADAVAVGANGHRAAGSAA